MEDPDPFGASSLIAASRMNHFSLMLRESENDSLLDENVYYNLNTLPTLLIEINVFFNPDYS